MYKAKSICLIGQIGQIDLALVSLSTLNSNFVPELVFLKIQQKFRKEPFHNNWRLQTGRSSWKGTRLHTCIVVTTRAKGIRCSLHACISVWTDSRFRAVVTWCYLNANAVLSQVTCFTLDNFGELLLFLEQHAEQVGSSSTSSVCLTSMHSFCQRHFLWPAYLCTVWERGVRMHSADHLCCALTLHQKVSSSLCCRLRFGDSESLRHWNLYEKKKKIAWSVHLFFLLIHLLELEKIWTSVRAHSLEPMATAHRFGLNCYKTFWFGCDWELCGIEHRETILCCAGARQPAGLWKSCPQRLRQRRATGFGRGELDSAQGN